MRLTTPFAKSNTMGDTAALLRRDLGAVEIEVPDDWGPMPDREFAIVLQGTKVRRPEWSRREAGQLAQAQLRIRDWLHRLNALGAKQNRGRIVSIPKRHTVQACPFCHELQAGTSRGSRRADECQVCPVECRSQHQSNQINCPDCRREMQVVWTSDDEIPKEWLQ